MEMTTSKFGPLSVTEISFSDGKCMDQVSFNWNSHMFIANVEDFNDMEDCLNAMAYVEDFFCGEGSDYDSDLVLVKGIEGVVKVQPKSAIMWNNFVNESEAS